MKNYNVSLAVIQPMNYQVEIKANNENEAIEKAINLLREGSLEGDFLDYGGSPEEDFNEFEKSGIFIEERQTLST